MINKNRKAARERSFHSAFTHSNEQNSGEEHKLILKSIDPFMIQDLVLKV